MKRFIQTCAVLCAVATAALAQQTGTAVRYCSTTGDVALTAAATTFTIQQSSGSTRGIYLESALVTTSVAGSFTQAVNGTAATTTAGTVTQLPTPAATSTSIARSFTASNVGAGTAIGGKVSTYAGGPGVVLNLSGSGTNITLKPTSTASNYSIIIASMTGSANVTVCWSER